MSLYIEDMDRFKDLPEMDETNCKKQKLNISKGFTFEFCNVSFKYPNMQEYAVKDLNMANFWVSPPDKSIPFGLYSRYNMVFSLSVNP